jgi:two-component system chemotaxis response regulator CheB
VPGDCLIVVTASTGSLGPLTRFLVALPAELDASVLVLSNLPSVFVDWFLDQVEPASALHWCRARDAVSLSKGAIYFSPCDCQLLVAPNDSLTLTCGAFPQGTGPSVDLTLSSLAARYGSAALCVILSGIGHAGIQGARDVHANGGGVIVQEPATCLAGETPQAVIEAGAATVVLPPERIAEEIVRRVKGGCRVGQFSVRAR